MYIMAVAFPATSITNAKPPKRSPQIDQLSKTQVPTTDVLLLYKQTLILGRLPSKFTLISTIKACTHNRALEEGKVIHAQIVKTRYNSDRFIGSALLRFYSACRQLTVARQVFDKIDDKDTILRTTMLVGYVQNGDVEAARELFDEIPERDIASWNAMLSGYNQNGMSKEALRLFQEMQIAKLRPNNISLVIILSACSRLGCLSLGKWVHSYMDRNQDIEETSTLINSVVHMYAKCGQLGIAFKLFMEKVPRNLESWNTMLTSFAIHGCGMSSLSLFSQMMKMGLTPDRITFVGLLMACSHCGMIDHAYRCFSYMTRMHSMKPRLEHYGCLVDVLSRSGFLENACKIIENMPFKPDAYVWGALLGGCLTHRNYELGKKAANHLLELEPYEESRYIALYNLHAMAGKLDEAVKVRELMMEMGIKNSPGSSIVEIDGVVHEFLAGDRSHYRSSEMYSMIELIDHQITFYGVYQEGLQMNLNS